MHNNALIKDQESFPREKQVVKVMWHKAASPPDIVFVRWRWCAPI